MSHYLASLLLVPAASDHMDLGSTNDWVVVVGLAVSLIAVFGVVWKLARAAVRLENAVELLTKQHAEQAVRSQEQWETFQSFQKETTASINELRMAVSRLTWEIDRRKISQDISPPRG